jgi:isopenicillin N synthase-like dioxygenase
MDPVGQEDRGEQIFTGETLTRERAMAEIAIRDSGSVEPAPARHPGTGREAVQTIPVIDISPCVADPDAASSQRVANELRKACIDVGFFYLSGHGLPAGELDEAIAWSHRFFDLPLDVKMRFRATGPGQAGFVRVGGINPNEDTAKAADLKERFVLARELGATSDHIGAESQSRWPADDVLPGFSRFMAAHLSKRMVLARALARAFALSLRLPFNYFDEYFRQMALVSLINYYPPLDAETVKSNRWSFSPHTDYGAFTLLSQDALGGLQVRTCNGDWIDVPPIDDTFVVNIGDLMAMWTNDLYTSTLHRAKNVSGAARISIPFFASPNGNAVIRCIETCQDGDNPPRYPPVTAGEYVRTLIARADQSGRPSVSDATSKRLQAN